MEIRRANDYDLADLHRLLRQVLEVHHAGRPDLFRSGTENIRTGSCGPFSATGRARSLSPSGRARSAATPFVCSAAFPQTIS